MRAPFARFEAGQLVSNEMAATIVAIIPRFNEPRLVAEDSQGRDPVTIHFENPSPFQVPKCSP